MRIGENSCKQKLSRYYYFRVDGFSSVIITTREDAINSAVSQITDLALTNGDVNYSCKAVNEECLTQSIDNCPQPTANAFVTVIPKGECVSYCYS